MLKDNISLHENIKLIKLKDGRGALIIFINGFLSQNNQDFSDWLRSVSEIYPDNPMYGIQWEADSLKHFVNLALSGIKEIYTNKNSKDISKKDEKNISKSKRNKLMSTVVSGLIDNPWHSSMIKAEKTGISLADLLVKINHKPGYILMGHSLGARVIYYTLKKLSARKSIIVREVYLLGGAVGNNKKGWEKALKSVDGRILNCYTRNDDILKRLYQGANLFMSKPIGITTINLSSKDLVNLDVSKYIRGHMEYKKQLKNIIHHVSLGNMLP